MVCLLTLTAALVPVRGNTGKRTTRYVNEMSMGIENEIGHTQVEGWTIL